MNLNTNIRALVGNANKISHFEAPRLGSRILEETFLQRKFHMMMQHISLGFRV